MAHQPMTCAEAKAENEKARIEEAAKLLTAWVAEGCEDLPHDVARRIIAGDDAAAF